MMDTLSRWNGDFKTHRSCQLLLTKIEGHEVLHPEFYGARNMDEIQRTAAN